MTKGILVTVAEFSFPRTTTLSSVPDLLNPCFTYLPEHEVRNDMDHTTVKAWNVMAMGSRLWCSAPWRDGGMLSGKCMMERKQVFAVTSDESKHLEVIACRCEKH